MPTQFTSPVGRFVQGDAFKGSDKDQQGNPRLVKSGPNIGKPMVQWFLGVAFPKANAQGYANPEWAAFKALIDAEAAASWPSLHPGGVRIPTVRFSDKIIDGDGYDDSGKPWNTREGFAGHWVVRFSSGYAPKCFPFGRYSPSDQIFDPSLLRRGYFVRIAGNLASNENAQKPGLYVNMSLVELAGYGPEIVSGPDAAAAFAAPVGAAPVGMSATPLAGAPAPPPPPGAPPPPPGAPPPPPPAAAPPPPPASPAAPYSGYRADVTPAHVMLPAAQGATYEAMIAAGWTDATLVSGGMMAPPAAAPAAPPPAPPAPPAPPPPPPTPPAPPPPPAGKALLPGVAGTYESWIAAGWTDEALIANGKMAA